MSTYPFASPSPPDSGAEPAIPAQQTAQTVQTAMTAPPAPAPGAPLHYAPRRAFWESKAVRTGALFTALAVCGVVILAVVRQHIGTEPFLVGLALAILPVPLLLWAFLWLDHVAPSPWQNVVFAFSWGSCAATLVAIFANEYGAKLLSSTFSGTATQTDQWGATFVAPLVEETAKGTAILLLFLFRRRHFESLLDGIVIGGLVATGFAFTENILYLGTAFSEDQQLGSHGSTTFATFFVRVLMTPFAHPLFTSMTGIGFAVAAVARPGRRWRWRWAPPVLGWVLAMALHGTWNGTSAFSPLTFLTVYVAVMIPAFGLVVVLAFWARSHELRTIRTHLLPYAAAGWLAPAEPSALGSMGTRAEARRLARRTQGEAAGRAVRDYSVFATHLAFLRSAAARGRPTADFPAREAELLHHLWSRKTWAQPALLHAAHPPIPAWYPPPPHPQQPPPAWAPYGQAPLRQPPYRQAPYGPKHL
ncbi:PrsW family intramembrane metalloprotease [Streptomyces sp. V4-01]|uniref:PrsW family intramembrane metalloprotease n=1 Tax=Actinacidiphila polyblastidii TaxID=3110430 RepID=A0ABU7PL22_9ACTN|nr:PrsW family intramembrane metalloprotease [Streptomyces sp. V4-01]